MDNSGHQQAFLEELTKTLATDRTRITVSGFTSLGLVEITRKPVLGKPPSTPCASPARFAPTAVKSKPRKRYAMKSCARFCAKHGNTKPRNIAFWRPSRSSICSWMKNLPAWPNSLTSLANPSICNWNPATPKNNLMWFWCNTNRP